MNTIKIVRHRRVMGFERADVLHDLTIAGCVVLGLMVGGAMAFYYWIGHIDD